MLRRSIAPLNAFLIAVVFVPGIQGAATSPRWLAASTSLYWLKVWPALFAVACFAALDFDAAAKWTILCAAFSWGQGASQSTLRNVVAAFGIGVAVSSLFVIAQVLGLPTVKETISPGGLFLNKNIVGEAACLALVAALRHRLWWIALAVAPALVLTTSKSVYLATVLALVLMWPRLLWWLPLALLAALLWAHPGLESTAQRFALWHEAFGQLTWFGNGSYEGSKILYGADYLHNDWLQLVWEMGLVGLVPVFVLCAAAQKDMAFCAALLVLGSFAFPLHMPATGFFAAFVVGYLLGRDPVRG